MSLFKEKIELKLEEAELRASQALSHYPPIFRYTALTLIAIIIPAYFIFQWVGQTLENRRLNPQRLSARQSFSESHPLELEQILLVKNNNNTYSAAVQITNPNRELSLNGAEALFYLYDQSGNQTEKLPIKFYILPNQTKWLLVPRISGDQTLVSAKVNFEDPLPWIKRQQIPNISIIAGQATIVEQDQPKGLATRGSITNASNYQIKEAEIIFLLSDKSGQIVSISTRTLNDLRPQERRDYVQQWPGFSGNGYNVEVLASTNALNSQNIAIPDSITGGDLNR